MSLYASAYEEDGPAAGCAVAIVSAKGLTDTLLIWDPDDTRTSGDTPRFEDAPDPYAIYLEPVGHDRLYIGGSSKIAARSLPDVVPPVDCPDSDEEVY